jgi:hypothetical protein
MNATNASSCAVTIKAQTINTSQPMLFEPSPDYYGCNKYTPVNDLLKRDLESIFENIRDPKSYTRKLLKQICVTTGVAINDAIEYIAGFENYQWDCYVDDQMCEEHERECGIRWNKWDD